MSRPTSVNEVSEGDFTRKSVPNVSLKRLRAPKIRKKLSVLVKEWKLKRRHRRIIETEYFDISEIQPVDQISVAHSAAFDAGIILTAPTAPFPSSVHEGEECIESRDDSSFCLGMNHIHLRDVHAKSFSSFETPQQNGLIKREEKEGTNIERRDNGPTECIEILDIARKELPCVILLSTSFQKPEAGQDKSKSVELIVTKPAHQEENATVTRPLPLPLFLPSPTVSKDDSIVAPPVTLSDFFEAKSECKSKSSNGGPEYLATSDLKEARASATATKNSLGSTDIFSGPGYIRSFLEGMTASLPSDEKSENTDESSLVDGPTRFSFSSRPDDERPQCARSDLTQSTMTGGTGYTSFSRNDTMQKDGWYSSSSGSSDNDDMTESVNPLPRVEESRNPLGQTRQSTPVPDVLETDSDSTQSFSSFNDSWRERRGSEITSPRYGQRKDEPPRKKTSSGYDGYLCFSCYSGKL